MLLFALAGALCYSELGINFPTSGGEYVYLRRAYGPVWGFLSGWVSFFAGFSAPIAAAALAFAGYLAFIFPSLEQESSTLRWEMAGIAWQVGATQAIAAGLVFVLTLLNCVGIPLVARVQNVLTTIKVIVIAAFVLLGFVVGQMAAGTTLLLRRSGHRQRHCYNNSPLASSGSCSATAAGMRRPM